MTALIDLSFARSNSKSQDNYIFLLIDIFIKTQISENTFNENSCQLCTQMIISSLEEWILKAVFRVLCRFAELKNEL